MNAKTEDYTQSAKSKLSDSMQNVQNRLGDQARYVAERTRHYSRRTDQYVRENPWMTLGMVALAACTLGWFLRMAQED